MDERDEQFENFLREFQPRQPRALPAPQIARAAWAPRLAATAMLAAALGCSLWLLSRRPFQDKPPNPAAEEKIATAGRSGGHLSALVPLTRLALQDPVRLDAALTEASRNVLPDLQRKNSTLHVLAKE